MDVKIRVCLPRKYGRFMLFIDNNLLLPGARLHILNNIFFHALTLSLLPKIHMLFIVSKQCHMYILNLVKV